MVSGIGTRRAVITVNVEDREREYDWDPGGSWVR